MVVPKPNPTKDELNKLKAQKEELEKRIAGFGDVLAANDNVGMYGPLIDAEGFPRNDIDVYQVRQARHQIICLQNDHKELMKQIEKLLHKLHAEAAEEERSGITTKVAGMDLSEDSIDTDENTLSPNDGSSASPRTLTVIVKVDVVSPGSPAEDAGLKINDGILEFGSVNSDNFSDLSQIGQIVQHRQNQQINLKVERDGQVLDLILIPKVWSGRGLLGCNIVRVDTVER